MEKLGLSYSNTRELNGIIDSKLPSRPVFKCREVIIDDKPYDVYFRDILACIRMLFGDLEFSRHLKTAPEQHYLDADKAKRRYSEMYTGNWWWTTQVCIVVSSIKCFRTHFDILLLFRYYLIVIHPEGPSFQFSYPPTRRK